MAFATIDVTKGITGTIPVANGGTGLSSGFKNGVDPRKNAKPLIINGDMAVHQRGSAGTSNNSFGVDRFKCSDTANFDQRGFTINQDTDVPSGYGFANSLKFTMTTPETTIDADEYGRVETNLEGQDVQLLKYGTSSAETVTLSFWVKSNVTGNYAVSLFQDDDTRIIGSTYTVNSSATWEKKVITFSGDTTGVIDDNNGTGLSLRWYMSAGSNFTSSDNTSWGASSNGKLAYGQVASVMSTTSGYWYITGIQLEVGEFSSTTLPPFQHESFGDNLARCQRYYYFHVSEDINGGSDVTISLSSQYNNSSVKGYITFPTRMRANPTLEQNTGSNMYRVYETNSNATFTTLTLSNETTEATGVFTAGSSVSVTAGSCGALQTMDSTAFVAFDAEL